MKRNIVLPPFVLQGINKNHRATPKDIVVFGCDTETCNGEPHTLQISSGGDCRLYYVDRKTILKTFLDDINEHIKKGQVAACYFHNLTFDLPVLFRNEPAEIWKDSNFRIRRHKWDCYVNCEKRFFARLNSARNKNIYIVDSFAYLPTSLDNIGKMLVPDLPKLKKPEGLGDVPLTTPEFEEYAKRDAVIEEAFGNWIVRLHNIYDVRISVSLPQMASFIFRHKFLKDGDNIALPPREVLRASLASYHGGKNGFYVKPGVYENCTEIDINSAYPYAMKQLPSFLKGRYKYVERFHPEYCGVYKISGEVHCPYNIFFNDEFKPVQGKFKNIWVTGYEIAGALKYDECRLDECTGYVWIPESDRNPLSDYVDHFYHLKNTTPKNDPMYNFYKLAMNALYGKFIQALPVNTTTPLTKKSGGYDYKVTKGDNGELVVEEAVKNFKAGGLFNPFIATQITGLVRGTLIHDLEHKFKALHTATDSVKTLMPVTGCSDELGGYKKEVKGMCLLIRNKLYAHFNEAGELKKYALHGFQGTIRNFLDLVVGRRNDYRIKHILKVREALRVKKESLKMLTLPKTFHFSWDKFCDMGFHYRVEYDSQTGKEKIIGEIDRRKGNEQGEGRIKKKPLQ